MKVLVYSDIHISQDSSIVKGFKGRYSTRLYYIIKSLDWAEKLADDLNCDSIFNLGDTFDKPFINAMEATAIQDIVWSKLPHYVLVGNHDSNVSSLEYSSVSVLKKLNFNIIDKPCIIKDIVCLPYVCESERKPINEYLGDSKSKLVFSHNDIAGFNFGGFVSKEGFKLDEINKTCSLFLNGHLHNSSWISDKVLNVGNLCGQNFSEDGFKYKHGAWFLDTETLEIKFYENPYALNFYKIQINVGESITKYKFGPNAVLMIKCERSMVESIKKELEKLNTVAYRILVFDSIVSKSESENVKLQESLDYMGEFCKFIKNELGDSKIVNEELAEIIK